MILVSVQDVKAGTFSPPHSTSNKATALREFGILVNDKSGTLLSQHPADFDLWQVGEYADFFDGKIKVVDPIVHLANGNDVKVSE